MIEWRTVLVGVIVVGLGVAALIARTYFGITPVPSQVMLVNRSSETISDARLKQGDNELKLAPLAPSESRSTDFVAREGPVTLLVEFSSGRKLSANKVGYLASGLPVVIVFDVTDDIVALRSVGKRSVGPFSRR